MAIKIFEKYGPTRANAPTSDYPQGSIKNESVPGANDGTPLDQEWGNDYAGFDAALFADAGITPNGNPDTSILSQRNDAIKIIANKSAVAPTTLNSVVTDTKLQVGMSKVISDRNNATYIVINAGTTPNVDLPNGVSIVQCTGVPSLALKIKSNALIDNADLGGTSSGGLNTIGCAFRIIPQGIGVDNTIEIINNSEHNPINSFNPTIGLITVEINHEQPNGSSVVGTTLAAPDEEMIKLGLQIGGSIAANKSVFFFSKPHAFIMDWENLVVIDPFMDVAQRYGVTDNTNHITVLHPRSYSETRGITPIDDTGPDATYIYFTDINTDFYPYKNDVTLQVLYNGATYELHHANPVIDAALSTLGFSVSESAGVFTITHPSARRDNANPTSSAGETLTGDYYSTWARPDSTFPKTQTIVVCPDLYNAASEHTFLTGEYFYVTLRDILWKFGKSAIDLGMVQVSPTLDFKNTGAGNNVWLLGNHWALK